MSIAAMNYYWTERDDITDKTELLFLLALSDFANDQGMCFPGLETLAKKCRVSKRTAIRTVQRLRDNGEIYIDERNGMTGPGGKTHRYHLMAFINRNQAKRGDILSPVEQAQGGDILSASGDILSIGGDILSASGDTAMSPDPSIEPPIDPPIESPGREAQPAPAWYDGALVAIDKSKRPPMTSKTSSRQAFTPQWEKRLRSCRVDLRKFHGGQVQKGEGVTPIEVWCEYFAADSLNDITAEQIERSVCDEQVPQFREAIIAWVSRGYNPKNVGGILEWMNPNKRRSNGNGHGQTQQRPGTTWVAHQPQGPAISLAELNARAAINYPDIDF